MKKLNMFLMFALLIIMSVSTIGCRNKIVNNTDGQKSKDDTIRIENNEPSIKSMDFTSDEKEILEGIGIHSNDVIYFKYSNLPDEYKGLNLWIEYYENGNLKNNPLIGLDSGGENVSIQRNGKVLCRFDGQTICLEGTSTKISKKTNEGIRIKSVNPKELPIDGEVFVLGLFAVNESKEAPGIDKTFYEEDLKVLEKIKLIACDELYVLKGQFHK